MPPLADDDNPCIGCGAPCCQYFRVSFYQGELDCYPGGFVPTALTQALPPFRACMNGTEVGKGRCVALGTDGLCQIYEHRPSVCRDFPNRLADGQLNPECVKLKAWYQDKRASSQS